jgi:hypothetical protein
VLRVLSYLLAVTNVDGISLWNLVVSLYVSVIIYSYTICKWLNFEILDIGTKQKKITLSGKLNVIHEVEAKSLISWVEIANHLGLAPSLSRIVLNKNKIIEGEMWSTLKEENEYKAGGSMKNWKKILLEWCQQMRSENVPISWSVLCQKTTDILLCLKIDNLKASNGWLCRHLKWTTEFNFLLKVYITRI